MVIKYYPNYWSFHRAALYLLELEKENDCTSINLDILDMKVSKHVRRPVLREAIKISLDHSYFSYRRFSHDSYSLGIALGFMEVWSSMYNTVRSLGVLRAKYAWWKHNIYTMKHGGGSIRFAFLNKYPPYQISDFWLFFTNVNRVKVWDVFFISKSLIFIMLFI